MKNNDDILQARDNADLLVDAAGVEQAVERMASAITTRLAKSNPLVLCVMNGGIVPTGWLLPRLDFPLQIDYVHASRYQGDIEGRELHWMAKPVLSVQNRAVLLIDDILDEGITLAGIVDWCRGQGAAEVLTAVLTVKQHDRNHTGLVADFVGLQIPDRYVFGCGLDYKYYWRNLPAIYAVKEDV